ncbi:Myb-like_DNA-binding domain-containing protein [Hexamita inflata]|uniref:Myb-like DNA-binding domain-containing protein n=1 Tax=Hexamita inflata TaxID=28002 RepID=A0AA86NWM3_9EUKA|nr:Myb-like DNA-binding domain-containing protein [Hexamita inflata]
MSDRNYGKWSQAEKEHLNALITRYQQKNEKPNWTEIATQMQTKTARQCYDQHNILTKKQNSSDQRHFWTQREEEQLLKLFKQAPYQWECIQSEFANISINQLKNKYNLLTKQIQAKAMGKVERHEVACQLKNLLGM